MEHKKRNENKPHKEALPCANPDCDNWVLPQNEVDIAVGIITDTSERICQQCAEQGYEHEEEDLPF